MPRLNGTGPNGQGPLTGHGGGYCIVRAGERPTLGAGCGDLPRGCGSGRCRAQCASLFETEMGTGHGRLSAQSGLRFGSLRRLRGLPPSSDFRSRNKLDSTWKSRSAGPLRFDPCFPNAVVAQNTVLEYAPGSPVSADVAELWDRLRSAVLTG